MKTYKYLTIFLIALLFSSCALKPIVSEYNYLKTNTDKVEINKLGNGTVLIYNGADIFHKIDNTARLNVWIDDKALGQIKPREYVIINLNNGNYQFKALHIDVVKFKSTHSVEIDSTTKIIKIKPSITSNKLTITNEFPRKFEKYKHAVKN